MPFYGDERKLVQEFRHKKIHIEIYRGLIGATCCDLEHEPEKIRCDICSKSIKARPVYFVSILGTEIMELPTQEEAVDWAKSFIDDRIDRLQADLYESLMDPEDDDDAPPEEQEESDDGPGALAAGKQDMTALEKQIIKLGWIQKANAILARIRPAA